MLPCNQNGKCASESRQQMMELIATVVITASSLFLFVYWFRYTCLLILGARTSGDYAAPVAVANQLGFLEVQSAKRQEPEPDRLKDMPKRDHRVLTYSSKNAANPSREENTVEKRTLDTD